MWIIEVRGMDLTGDMDHPVVIQHEIQELLDCVCDSFDEAISYCAMEAVRVCKQNNLDFLGFDLIAY